MRTVAFDFFAAGAAGAGAAAFRDELDLVLDGAARCREGARTVPSPRIDSFIRLFNSPARPPLRVNRPTVTSESIWGRPAVRTPTSTR